MCSEGTFGESGCAALVAGCRLKGIDECAIPLHVATAESRSGACNPPGVHAHHGALNPLTFLLQSRYPLIRPRQVSTEGRGNHEVEQRRASIRKERGHGSAVVMPCGLLEGRIGADGTHELGWGSDAHKGDQLSSCDHLL